ncbi:MAG: type II secretion system GspH family protein [Candidatus Pacebacteria bacterium]|nr:type II secretion system GspH family protein [Candidatus Paceibacterota bacterium]
MKKFLSKTKQKGFTLIELLVVIAIIAILAVSVFVALDPVTRFADARNSRRWSDVNSYLTAVHQYIVDNGGALPTGMTTSMVETQIGTCPSGGDTICTSAAGACVNLTAPLAKYLKTLPQDSDTGSAATTGYSVSVDANNLITIKSCSAENSEIVEVSR